MIFYFTGTGNSYYAAKKIGDYHDEQVISISEEIKAGRDLKYKLKEDEIIGFVYPVYAWAPPRIVLDFIKNIQFEGYKGNYAFSVAVCGDNIGETMKVFKEALSKKDIQLQSGFSLIMPNNYIVSYDVDPRELEETKLSKAEESLKEINNVLKEGKSGIFNLEKGPVPGFLTYIFSPLFNKFIPNTKKFYATDDCTSCGLCQKICSTGNITVNKKPAWGANCAMCMACIHRCPVRAIQYGKSTLKKGRYFNPIYR